jgi:peptidyl-prolyl cis-trans isomerase D
MLQQIRDGMHSRKWIAWLALAPIAVIFVFWGGSNTLDFSGVSQQDAAEVDGVTIPAAKATKMWANTQRQWSQQFGTEIPEDQRTRIQENILDQLVVEQLLENIFKDENYRVSDARVLSEFERQPAFKGPDGKYDAATARQILAMNNITEQEFFDESRSQLLVKQIEQGIAGSYFLTRSDQQRLFNLENEEREVAHATFSPAQFVNAEPVEDAAIQAYYDKNGDRFMSTESVSLDYAELRLEQVASQVVPTEEQLRELYDTNRANYVVEEHRRARHILIPIDGENDAAALKQAESVLAEARAGKDFAELAKKYSKDSTAANGGELEFVAKGDFPGPFEDTLFGMKVGDIAGPVKSQFGYHLIKLEEIQAGEAKPFESVRAELDSQYRLERSGELFGDRQEDMSRLLEGGETDLDKIAQALGLTRGSIAEFLRGGGAEPLGSGIELQQVVFGDTVLNQRKIGGPVMIGEDRLVLVKVTAHHKAAVKPLAQVRDEIVALIVQERGVAAAQAAAAALVPRLEAGEDLATLAAAAKVTAESARFVSRGDPSIPEALRLAIFEAPRPEAKPVVKSVKLDDGSTAVFVVTRSRVGDSANAQLVQQQNAMLLQRSAAGELAAYVNEAKRKVKIVKNPKVFEY